jgi:hypothetical protein
MAARQMRIRRLLSEAALPCPLNAAGLSCDCLDNHGALYSQAHLIFDKEVKNPPRAKVSLSYSERFQHYLQSTNGFGFASPKLNSHAGESRRMKSSAGRKGPEKRSLRHFAWIIALVLAIAARYSEPNTRTALTLAAAIVFAVGTVLPQVFSWPVRLLLIGFYPVIRLATMIFPVHGKSTVPKPSGQTPLNS